MRPVQTAVALAIVATACGGGNLTMAEYNEQGAALVEEMETRIATLDEDWDAQPPSVERARTYWDHRLDARHEALDGLQVLKPPDQIADLVASGLDLFAKLVSAEEVLAARVASYETPTGPDDWWATAEADAVRAVEDEIDELCQVFQATYDASLARAGLEDVPWLPPEMKEIIQVDVGCRP